MVDYLLELPGLIDQYSQKDPKFLDSSLSWLSGLEQDLLKLRHPISGFVATERGKIFAVDDGFIDPNIVESSRSKRKKERATVALVLGKVQEALRAVLEDIDEKFTVYRDKMAQLIALATQRDPLPAPIEPQEEWLKKVWEFLSKNEESKALYTYLNTALTSMDRNYILQSILEHLV